MLGACIYLSSPPAPARSLPNYSALHLPLLSQPMENLSGLTSAALYPLGAGQGGRPVY
jgi:hypothetical protein